MTRVPLTDESGRWFNTESAVKFDESTWWNGNNHISRATGSQWNHEALYFTKSKRWILNRWSQYQNVAESYESIDESEAIRWLVCNECFDDFADLPESVRAAVESSIAQSEL